MELKACFPHWVPVFTSLFSLMLGSKALPGTNKRIIIITINVKNRKEQFWLHSAPSLVEIRTVITLVIEAEEETGSWQLLVVVVVFQLMGNKRANATHCSPPAQRCPRPCW